MILLAWACVEELPAVAEVPAMRDVCTAIGYGCAIRMDTHQLVCWGDEAVDSPPVGEFVDVDCSMSQACARAVDGSVNCWRSGHVANDWAPSTLEGVFDAVSAGVGYACGVASRQGTCQPDSDPRAAINAEQFTQLVAGLGCSCGLLNGGRVQCWGGDYDVCRPEYTLAPVELTLGAYHGCARSEQGTVECWGGLADYGVVEVPDESFRQISAGDEFTCGITDDLRVVCWQGSVYNLTETGTTSIVDAPSGPDYIQVSAGWDRACALTSEGVVDCWGASAGETLQQELGIGGW